MKATLLVVVAALVALTPAALAHDDNTDYEFWLSSNPGSSCDLTMYQGDTSQPGTQVIIADGDSRTWEADFAAQSDLLMGGGGQVYTLTLLILQGSGLEAELGVCHVDGSFTPCGDPVVATQGIAGPVLLPGQVQTITSRNENFVFQPDAQCIVPEGDFLAIRVTSAGGTLSIGTSDATPLVLPAKERSHLHTTLPSPPYPLPELSSVLLAGAGLGLVGLVALRRQ